MLTTDTINKNVLAAKYAVRGAIPMKAVQIDNEIHKGKKYPFEKVIFCNIGNPQQLGQPHLTFHRQVLACCLCPSLISDPIVSQTFPQDVIDRARFILQHTSGGLGAYSHTQGVEYIREDVADFLARRDGVRPAISDIFLTNGASPGVSLLLSVIIRDHSDGIMIPIPQYPLYSGTIALLGGTALNYFLREETGWQLEIDNLRATVEDARTKRITPRALVIINPGNPTATILSEENMVEVMRFCKHENLVLFADEVYQENIHLTKRWVSFRKVLLEHPELAGLQLVSFHSCSKGFFGECGLRGGYFQLEGFDAGVRAEIYKLSSLSLCPNLVGQTMVDLMVKPPSPGMPSHALYEKEVSDIKASLKRRAKMVSDALNKLPGYTCQPLEGALYAFPSFTLPASAVEAAKLAKMAPDAMYCMGLLEQEGLCVVPGSGFGQKDGTYHFRTTILPQEADMPSVVSAITRYHTAFMEKYQ